MKIYCCGKNRKALSYQVTPNEGYLVCYLHMLIECPECGKYTIELERTDAKNNYSVKRFENSEALELYDKLEPYIEGEIKYYYPKGGNSRSYLCYNEYGKKKKCYSNLSSMRLGVPSFGEIRE